jgi:cytochrome c556
MAAAASLESMANKVAEAAATEDKARIAAAMKDFGKKTCAACHDAFRGPKPKGSM